MQLADRVAHVKQRQEPGRMPGGARGQFRALQQHDIRPAFFGQVIQRADADNAATDDDNSSMRFHGMIPLNVAAREVEFRVVSDPALPSASSVYASSG